MSKQTILETEQALTKIKSHFSSTLAQALNLHAISSPMIVRDGRGINDDLNGTERPVSFPIKALADQRAVVVHSLAKWKRLRLKELDLAPGEGVLTDMKALRPDEDYSAIHSVYVDQWDWELCITPQDRTLTYLKNTVEKIYASLLATERLVEQLYGIAPILPKALHFIQAEELLQRYPQATPKERECQIAQLYGAVFIIGIGANLSDGYPHDKRAADYDDWSSDNGTPHRGLNGDLILWNPVLNREFEISSMGIRVDQAALERQLQLTQQQDKAQLMYHRQILEGKLPLCIGGGLGQSRICMFLLRKKHIGEVQASIWPDEEITQLKKQDIHLL